MDIQPLPFDAGPELYQEQANDLLAAFEAGEDWPRSGRSVFPRIAWERDESETKMLGDKANSTVLDDVVAGLEEGIAWARGEKDLRVSRIDFPEPPPAYSPEQICAIRAKSGMSQILFSRYLSISSKTLQSWEQGARNPSPISARFLQIIELEPNVLQRIPIGPAIDRRKKRRS